MNTTSLRVAVVGGGAFGSAAAFRLAAAGCRVTLIDDHDLATQSSLNNGGNLNPLLMTPAPLLPLALASFQAHIDLRADLQALGIPPYAMEPVRRLLLAFQPGEEQSFSGIEQRFRQQPGFSARYLDAKSVLKKMPELAADIQSALLLEGNFFIDGADFLHRLHQGMQRYGVILHQERVVSVQSQGALVCGVQTAQRSIRCDAVVFATGAWTDSLQQWLGVSLPIIPVKGQMLRTRLRGYVPAFDVTYGEISLYRRRGDEIWIGMTQELAGFDTQATAEAREFLWRGAVRVIPKMAEAEIISQHAALRPTSADGMPLVQKVEDCKNAFVINGGGMKGMLLCAGVAQQLMQIMIP